MTRGLIIAIVGAAALLLAAQAQGEKEAVPSRTHQAGEPGNWSAWTRPLGGGDDKPIPVQAVEAPGVAAEGPARSDDVDVVDAHWMALTMWGEGRGQSEDGMRAVGHVIHNRWLAKRHGSFVTETVSEAYQFSCWNQDDPNREKMLNVEALPKNSRDYLLWLAAKRIAGEILSGRSMDPTDGAHFYHTAAVQPRWSEGLSPVKQIGSHLFFLAAR